MKYVLFIVGSWILMTSCKEKKTIKAGEKMQQFIIEISRFARNQDPDFILIPQNGEEVLFQDINPDNDLYFDVIQAIDGMGAEELFFNETTVEDEYRLNMLRKVNPYLQIMVADYVANDADLPTAQSKATDEQFISFPRSSANYDYKYIPSTVQNENTNDVLELAQAQNYLYLISTDGFTDKSNYLTAIQQTNFDVVIIDAFYGEELLSVAEVSSLKTKLNGGKRLVISYMNIGSAEKYRYYWKKSWGLKTPLWLKKKYDGYKDEIWVKFWNDEWKDIIYGNSQSYTQKLLDCGFDGAYLDNISAFYFLYHKN